jgi:hypothetical protein
MTSMSSSIAALSMTKRRSPIAPRRSSFEVVPSSWTRTSLPRAAAHWWNAGALRAFVTTWISSIASTSAIASTIQSMIGWPPTGRSSFAHVSVSGRSRVA